MSANKNTSSVEELPPSRAWPITNACPWGPHTAQTQRLRRDSLDEEDFPALGSSDDDAIASTTSQINPVKENMRIAALNRERPTSRQEAEDPEECMMSGGLSEDDRRCQLGGKCAVAKSDKGQSATEHTEGDQVESPNRQIESSGHEYSDDTLSDGRYSEQFDSDVMHGTGTQWGRP